MRVHILEELSNPWSLGPQDVEFLSLFQSSNMHVRLLYSKSALNKENSNKIIKDHSKD